MEPPLLLKITYVQPDGTCRQVQARAGVSLMEAAVRANVEGIEAKCRGNCACVTCHVYIDPQWSAVMGAPGAMEESMLDFAENVEPNSRLSCQIRVSDDLDGLIVRLPQSQH